MKVIKIGNEDYVIKYSINNLIAMENLLGKPFTQIFGEDGQVSLNTLRTLIYCGLQGNKHNLTETGAGEILSSALDSGEYDLTSIAQEFINEMTKSLGIKSADVAEIKKVKKSKNA